MALRDGADLYERVAVEGVGVLDDALRVVGDDLEVREDLGYLADLVLVVGRDEELHLLFLLE